MEDRMARLAGVFDRAVPAYDRIGEAHHAHVAERLLDHVAPPRDAPMLDIAALESAGSHPLRLSALIVTGRS